MFYEGIWFARVAWRCVIYWVICLAVSAVKCLRVDWWDSMLFIGVICPVSWKCCKYLSEGSGVLVRCKMLLLCIPCYLRDVVYLVVDLILL